jgi:phosphoglucosamine mutase
VVRALVAAGAKVVRLGVLPTPAVARAVRGTGASLGVVITASHNPASDNGIKFFGPGGVKLTDEDEARIECNLLDEMAAADSGGPTAAGQVEARAAEADYIASAEALLPARSLVGWRVVLDTANGATCGTSPVVLRRLGAEVIGLGDGPDGLNINARVGSEYPEALAARVVAEQARLGIAHDGDGDRCILCDESGAVLDGDEILTILATYALKQGCLAERLLVVTVQSNQGVDTAIRLAGGRVARTEVGDRYVAERMRADGATLGGESSGHVICSEVSPTGDGLVAALKVIAVMQATGQPLSVLRRVLVKCPQMTAALRVRAKPPLASLASLSAVMRELAEELGEEGRVLVRYSGTEAKLRLLVEGPTPAVTGRAMDRLKAAVVADGLEV